MNIGKFEVQGEMNHSPSLWGTADVYQDAVAIARASTGDKSDGPQWGDPNQGVTAHILWVGDGRRFKLAVVSSVDTAKVDLADGFVGDFCVVPDEYPDEIFLFVWSRRYEARPSSRDERFFMTHPEPTPDEAWQDFLGEDRVPQKWRGEKRDVLLKAGSALTPVCPGCGYDPCRCGDDRPAEEECKEEIGMERGGRELLCHVAGAIEKAWTGEIEFPGCRDLISAVPQAVLSTAVLPGDGIYYVETLDLRSGLSALDAHCQDGPILHYVGHPATRKVIEACGAVYAGQGALFEGLKVGECALCFPIAQGRSDRSKGGSAIHQEVSEVDLSCRRVIRLS